MVETIVAPIITGVITLTVCLINNYYQSKKTQADFKAHFEKTIAIIELKINELTKRMDKHNNVIERTYQLEQDTALQEEKIKVANNRIKDLETICKDWDGVERRQK